MKSTALKNTHIDSEVLLATPREIQDAIPHNPRTMRTVLDGRTTIERILDGEDRRLIAIVGPCSIHDLDAAAEYAAKLKKLADEISGSIFVVMRAYFEKPRSSIGWKGLINDPYMNDTFHIGEGLRMARHFLHGIADMGLPAGTELLDTLVPQYIGDLVSWSAVGARTAEAQTHRAVASGSSSPVGFKNGTDGSIETAVNAVRAAMGPQHFLGFTENGMPAVFSTTGNPYPHIVLRGGKTPNYDSVSVATCIEALRRDNLPESIIIDCSHANSQKKPELQAAVLDSVLQQAAGGTRAIKGFMLESYHEAGSQPIAADRAAINPRISVTDPCIDWPTTERLLRDAHSRHAATMKAREKPTSN